MKMTKKIGPLLFLVVIPGLALPLGATGLRGFELSARAASLAGAFVGRADDVSAVFYNPAGLVFQPGLRLQVGVQNRRQFITAQEGASDPGTNNRGNAFWASLFISWTVKDRISLGFGIFPLYSLDTDWPETWPHQTEACRNEFHAFSLRPVVAMKIIDSLALSVGVDFINASHFWNFYTVDDFTILFAKTGVQNMVDLIGSGRALTAGWMFAPSPRFRLGGRWHSGADIEMKGTMMSVSYRPITQTARRRVRFPPELVLGLTVKPLNRLTVHAEGQWTDWSRSGDWTIALESYSQGSNPIYDLPTEVGWDMKWNDTLRISCGLQYDLSPVLFLRTGYERLPSVLKKADLHPFLPDLKTDVLSLGLGYEGPFFDISGGDRLGDMNVDVFFLYQFQAGGASALPGLPLTYSGHGWTVGAAVGFILGARGR